MNRFQEELLTWPAKFAEEDFDPPSDRIRALAFQLSEMVHPDYRMMPDADGGVVFKCISGDHTLKYHVWDDGSIDFVHMKVCKVVVRCRLTITTC